METAQEDDDIKASKDIKDQALVEHILFAQSMGGYDLVLQKMKDMADLSEEDLENAYGGVVEGDETLHKDYKQSYDKVIERAERIKDLSDQFDELFPDPGQHGEDDSDLKTGKQLQDVRRARQRAKAFIILNQNSALRTMERMESISKELYGEKAPFWKKDKTPPASEITRINNVQNIDDELVILKNQIKALKGFDKLDDTQKKDLKSKERLVENLVNMRNAMSDFVWVLRASKGLNLEQEQTQGLEDLGENSVISYRRGNVEWDGIIVGETTDKKGRPQWLVKKSNKPDAKPTRILKTSTGIFDKKSKMQPLLDKLKKNEEKVEAKLKSEFRTYMEFIGKENNNKIDPAKIDAAYESYRDLQILSRDEENLTELVSMLLDPKGYVALVSEYNKAIKQENDDEVEILAEQFKLFYETEQAKELVQDLVDNYGVFIIQDDLEALLTDNIVPREVYDTLTTIPLRNESTRHKEALEAIEKWQLATGRVEKEEIEEEEEIPVKEIPVEKEVVVLTRDNLDKWPQEIITQAEAIMETTNAKMQENDLPTPFEELGPWLQQGPGKHNGKIGSLLANYNSTIKKDKAPPKKDTSTDPPKKPTQASEIEAKKADIQRRRQEELDKGVETRVGSGEFEYSELTPDGGLGFIAMGAATMRDQIVKKLDGKERLSAQKFMSMLFEMGKSLEEVADRLEKKYKIRVSGGKYQIQETEYNKINAKYDKLVALEKQAELAALGTKTDETESQPTITSKALKQKIEDKKLELPNTIDKEIIAVSEELKEVEGKKAYKIIGSPEYKRLYELNTKRANKEITTEELEELRELEDDIDQWMMITGSVAEGIRLSDLIRQKAILETAVISPIENVVTPTEEQLIESSDTGENSKSANYSFSQSYDGVTIMINNDGQTEISGITWQKFIALAGIPISTVQVKKKAGEDTIFEPFTVNDRGNIVLTAELVEEINEIGNLTIGATNQDLITSFSMVLHTNESTNDETKTETTVLKSDFLFETPMDTDAIYGMKENDEIALEIDPKDPWNKKLIGAYRKAIKSKAKGKAKEKAIDKAIKDMRDSLLIRVRKTTGEREFVAVLKSKRKRVKDAETAAKFEALRDQIVSENLESLLDGNSRTLKGFEITVDTILVGHPNFNYKKNEDNKIVVETKALTENDIDKIEDTGYLDENGPHTRSGKKGLDIRLLRKAQRDNDKGAKIPFVVISKGNTRIAIPVVIDPNESDSSLDKFEEIYNSKSEAIDRASALNIFMAERGLDIKLQGNSFIVAGEASNINDNTFFTNKLAQLEEINYFRDLETWAKKDISKEEVLRDGVSSKINLDNPIHSPKLKLNFKNMDIEISEEFVPDVESVNRNTSKNGPKKFNERLRKNEKKEC